MAGMNRVEIEGRLGREPELRYLPNGSGICQFSVAAERSWKDKTSDEWKSETEWANVVVWGPLGELAAERVRKGDLVHVIGRLQTRKWDGKDGQTHYKTEVVADSVSLPLTTTAQGAREATSPAARAGADDDALTDLPF